MYSSRRELYDDNLFVQTPSESSVLRCGICKFVMKDSRRCINDHAFCLLCIERSKQSSSLCPVCRTNISASLLVNRSIDELIGDLIVFCETTILEFGNEISSQPLKKQKLANEGLAQNTVSMGQSCDWQGPLRLLDHHLGECGFVKVNCQYCNTVLPRRHIIDHESKNCASRPTECTWCKELIISTYHYSCPKKPSVCAKCGEGILGCEYNHRRSTCSMEEISCPYRDMTGCSYSGFRKDMPNHTMDSSLHFKGLMEWNQQLNIACKNMQRRSVQAAVNALGRELQTPVDRGTSKICCWLQEIMHLTGNTKDRLPSIHLDLYSEKAIEEFAVEPKIRLLASLADGAAYECLHITNFINYVGKILGHRIKYTDAQYFYALLAFGNIISFHEFITYEFKSITQSHIVDAVGLLFDANFQKRELKHALFYALGNIFKCIWDRDLLESFVYRKLKLFTVLDRYVKAHLSDSKSMLEVAHVLGRFLESSRSFFPDYFSSPCMDLVVTLLSRYMRDKAIVFALISGLLKNWDSIADWPGDDHDIWGEEDSEEDMLTEVGKMYSEFIVESKICEPLVLAITIHSSCTTIAMLGKQCIEAIDDFPACKEELGRIYELQEMRRNDEKNANS